MFCSWAAFLGKGMVFDSHDICEESFFLQFCATGVPHVKPLKG